MLRSAHKLVLIPVVLSLVSVANGFQTSRRSPLDWANELVNNIRLENTDYQHKRGVVKWKGVDGATDYESHTDCSGLLNAILEQSYGLSTNDFQKWLGVRRPVAINYHDAIAQGNGFSKIEYVFQIKPGDVIAIAYPPDSDNSGHIMIIVGKPEQRAPTEPIMSDNQQWEVSVIDSSESGHGKIDTRRLPNGAFAQGVGKGVFRLYTDKRGRISGYAWSTLANSEYRDQNDRNLVVGRLTRPHVS